MSNKHAESEITGLPATMQAGTIILQIMQCGVCGIIVNARESITSTIYGDSWPCTKSLKPRRRNNGLFFERRSGPQAAFSDEHRSTQLSPAPLLIVCNRCTSCGLKNGMGCVEEAVVRPQFILGRWRDGLEGETCGGAGNRQRHRQLPAIWGRPNVGALSRQRLASPTRASNAKLMRGENSV